MALWEGDLSLSKAYEGLLCYAKGSPLTLHNHFVQLYRALDTIFFESWYDVILYRKINLEIYLNTTRELHYYCSLGTRLVNLS